MAVVCVWCMPRRLAPAAARQRLLFGSQHSTAHGNLITTHTVAVTGATRPTMCGCKTPTQLFGMQLEMQRRVDVACGSTWTGRVAAKPNRITVLPLMGSSASFSAAATKPITGLSIRASCQQLRLFSFQEEQFHSQRGCGAVVFAWFSGNSPGIS